MKHTFTVLFTLLVFLLAALVPCSAYNQVAPNRAAAHHVGCNDDEDDETTDDETTDEDNGDEESEASEEEGDEAEDEGDEADDEDDDADDEEEDNDSILAAYIGVELRLQKEMRANVLAAGGQIIKHVVQRGEDYESIAERYGINYADIKVLNPFYEDAYAGVTLEIPVMPVMTNKATAATSTPATATSATPAAVTPVATTTTSAAMPPSASVPTAASNTLAAAPTPTPTPAVTPTPAPVTASTAQSKPSAAPLPKVDSRYARAKSYLDDKDYKKAIKTYSEIIDGGQPLLTAYVGRGIAYYNRKKYSHAIKDLNRAYNMASGEDKESAQDIYGLLEQAKSAKAARDERRGQIWGGIILAAAQGAATYFAVKEQSEMQKNYANYMSGGYASTGVSSSASRGSARNLDYLLDPRLCAMQTLRQMEIQNEQEYQMARSANPSLTREQFIAMKAEAYAAVQQAERGGGSSGYTSTGTTYRTGTTTSSSGTCNLCHGTGNIGKETYPAGYGYSDNTKEKCNTCGKTFLRSSGHTHVTCPVCHGRG